MTSNDGGYGWTSHEPTAGGGQRQPIILALLKKLNIESVIDIGSGNGALCGALADNGYKAVGVEHDSGGVAIARAAFPNLKFYNLGVQDDASEILKIDGPFDAALSLEVVEHLYKPEALPAFARGVLKSGGIFIITTPYHGYIKNVALSILGRWDKHHSPLWTGGHIKFWSKSTLTALLIASGFEVIGFFGVGRVHFLWKSMGLVARKVG